MKILYIGCVASSKILLECLLHAGNSIVGVITKQSSSFHADFCDLKPLCDNYHIDSIYVNQIQEEKVQQFIEEKKPDIFYCFGWSQLIPSYLLSIPPLGGIGFHPAALPDNRGRHPIIWALFLGLSKTASTFFFMDEQADTGAILSQEEIPITYLDTAQTLYEKIMQIACQQVLSFTPKIESGMITYLKQEPMLGNSWRKRTAIDGQIDWRMSSYSIYNLIRALTHPYPGAHFLYQNQSVKVWKAKEVITDRYLNIEPGKVLHVYSDTCFLVKAYDHVIEIQECEPIHLTEGEYL